MIPMTIKNFLQVCSGVGGFIPLYQILTSILSSTLN